MVHLVVFFSGVDKRLSSEKEQEKVGGKAKRGEGGEVADFDLQV